MKNKKIDYVTTSQIFCEHNLRLKCSNTGNSVYKAIRKGNRTKWVSKKEYDTLKSYHKAKIEDIGKELTKLPIKWNCKSGRVNFEKDYVIPKVLFDNFVSNLRNVGG